MQVQSITNLKSVAPAAADSSKLSEVGNSFAKLMSEAIQSNPDYNLDYVIAAKTSQPVQDNAVNIAAPNVQTQAALDVSSWLDSHSQLSAALSKSTEPAVQEAKSNAIEKPSQAKSLPYLDANGQPTKDIKLAIQGAKNELDSKVNDLLGFKNDDFELGGKLYGKLKSDEIVSWHNNAENKAKLGAMVKQAAEKFGLPADTTNLMPTVMIKPLVDNQVALAGRASLKPDYAKFPDTVVGRSEAFQNWQTSSKYYVDPLQYSKLDDYVNAQSAASLNRLTDEVNCYKGFGVDVLAPESTHIPSSHALSLARLNALQGRGAGDDVQVKANWFGTSIENYEKAVRGESNAVKLESPLQRLASEVARAASVLKPEEVAKQYPKVFGENGLAAKFPDTFSSASNEFKTWMQKNFPASLEYESTLKSKA
jgi:hypothetical protein